MAKAVKSKTKKRKSTKKKAVAKEQPATEQEEQTLVSAKAEAVAGQALSIALKSRRVDGCSGLNCPGRSYLKSW